MSDENTQQTARETRRKILKKAMATVNGESRTILIRDLSPHGALLKVDQTFTPGEFLVIHIEAYPDLRAEVRWADGDRIGVRFEEGISLDENGLPVLAKSNDGESMKGFVPWNPYTAQTTPRRPAVNKPKIFGRADPKRPIRS